jgi:hypothetical protein
MLIHHPLATGRWDYYHKKEPLAKLFISVILNGVNDLKRLKIRDSSLSSE